ncbi:MAG: 50S ribosomal protein L4 [Candidatus Neomarinimicrobiota bacterium]|nr:50S ribosomal protein L4 [Candidatus Neomarinimicrobiota bacterium]
MDFPIHNSDGEVISKMKATDSVFKIEPNRDVIYRAVMSEMTNSRQGTHSTKTRSEVRGGGRKPWRQKGRGVARAGTIRSPLWKGGGVTHGPRPKNYKFSLPKKMKSLARRSALAQRASDEAIVVIEEVQISSPKTKEFLLLLKKLGIDGKKVTFLPLSTDENVFRSARNISNVTVIKATSASTYDLLDAEVLLFEKEGLKKLDDQLAVN